MEITWEEQTQVVPHIEHQILLSSLNLNMVAESAHTQPAEVFGHQVGTKRILQLQLPETGRTKHARVGQARRILAP